MQVSKADTCKEDLRKTLRGLGTSHIYVQKMEVGTPRTSVHHVGQDIMVVLVRSDPSDRRKRKRRLRGGPRDCWVEHVMRRKYFGASNGRKNVSKEVSVDQDELWTRAAWEKMRRTCCATRKMAWLKCTSGLRKYRRMLLQAWRGHVRETGWARKGDEARPCVGAQTSFVVCGETEGRGASIASFSQWKISCGGCPPFTRRDERIKFEHEWLVVRSFWTAVRKPNRLLTLQIGDRAHEQVIIPVYCALKLLTNLIKGNKLGAVVKFSFSRKQ